MKKIKTLALGICVLLCSSFIFKSSDAFDPAKANGPIDGNCMFNGKKMYGKIQFVTSFPDVKVQIVNSFPDLKVQMVSSFPDQCGKWQSVSSFPDLKVQIVTSFPDVKVQYVNSFPGRP